MKIVGYTVGTPLPKPNFDQTDPRKGDFIKGDRSFTHMDESLTETGRPADAKATGDAINNLQANIDTVADLVGGSSVSEQIEAAIANKADSEHSHDSRYYTIAVIDEKLDTKADSSEVPTALSQLTDDTMHRLVTDDEKAVWNNKSDFSGDYNDLTNKPSIPSIEGLATSQYVNDQLASINGELDNKADAVHSHNDVYYTETEIDTKVSAINTSISNITNSYETKTDAQVKLNEAKSYTDTKTDGLASETVVDNKIITHNTSSSAHNDIRDIINTLTTRLNTLADSDDETLDQMSEIVTYIKSNKTLIEEVTTKKVNVADIIDNLTTNVSNKPLSAAQGVVLDGLINELNVAINEVQNNFNSHKTDSNAHADIRSALSTAEVNAQVYTDQAVSQKTQVQIITWGADD